MVMLVCPRAARLWARSAHRNGTPAEGRRESTDEATKSTFIDGAGRLISSSFAGGLVHFPFSRQPTSGKAHPWKDNDETHILSGREASALSTYRKVAARELAASARSERSIAGWTCLLRKRRRFSNRIRRIPSPSLTHFVAKDRGATAWRRTRISTIFCARITFTDALGPMSLSQQRLNTARKDGIFPASPFVTSQR